MESLFRFTWHNRVALDARAIAGTGFDPVEQVQHGVVFLTKQANGVLLLDRPEVERQGQVISGFSTIPIELLSDFSGFRSLLPEARRWMLFDAIEHILVRISTKLSSILTRPVGPGVVTSNHGFVDRDQVRRTERLDQLPRSMNHSVGIQPKATLGTQSCHPRPRNSRNELPACRSKGLMQGQ